MGSRRMSVKRTNYALKPSQQVFAQRGDRACGGIDTLLTYEQYAILSFKVVELHRNENVLNFRYEFYAVELQRKVSHYLQPILSHRFLNNLA